MPFKDKEKRKEYLHQYYLRNKRESLKKQKLWKKRNKDKIGNSQRKYRLNNREELNKKARIYMKENRDKVNKNNQLPKKKHPKKHKARYLSKRILVKKSCGICNSKDNLQKHHWDYNKPLMVNTLCKECHNIQHIKRFKNSFYGGGLK
jgi:hypothetical protein